MLYRTSKLVLSLLFAQSSLAKEVILEPPTGAEGTPVAVIWIHGMECQPEAYQTIATEVQNVAKDGGYKAWVGVPEFLFDVPEPVLIDHYVQSTLAELKKKGFTGDNVFLAAHSLGGVMTQIYSKGRTDIKGQILMGSVLLRDTRSLNSDGKTEFKAGIPPTLTLAGEKDGLLRITRGAESYWHQT